MLHKMSEVRGWGHQDMMAMSKTLFYRYYGYWYQDQLNEERYQKWREANQKLQSKGKEAREYKELI
jgi:hypothetical protein